MEWWNELGLATQYAQAGSIATAISSLAGQALPAQFIAVTGTSWVYLALRLVVALGPVWVFDEDIVSTDPQRANAMLAAVLAVGLIPGTRELLRLTFGL